jgi:SAM-dependent methyltransferase
MAHPEQRDFLLSLKRKFPSFFREKKVLDIGSLNINGTARDFFDNSVYTGIDIGLGSGVDVIARGESFDVPDDSFDVVLSCECFEHNPAWRETFINMTRLCKPQGLLFFTCATNGRSEHGTSEQSPSSSPLTISEKSNYYKNLNEMDFSSWINLDDYFSEYQFSVNRESQDLYFYGIIQKRQSSLEKILTCLRIIRK